MNTEALLDNVGTIAESTSGVDRLRLLILNLAFGGQLTAAESSDIEPVIDLDQLGILPVTDSIPPSRWQHVRLGEVAEVRLGRQRSPQRAIGDRMKPYLRAANVTWAGLVLDDVKQMDFTAEESVSYELRAGDLLLSEASGSPMEVGKPAQYRGEIDGCCFQNTLIRVRLPEFLSPDFYERYFRQQALIGRFAENSRGMGINHLGAKKLAGWLIPVPSRSEQQTIVAKVDQLNQLCDKLEARQQARHQLASRLRASSLDALTNAETADDLRTAWTRVRTNWESLVDELDGVGAIRQTILQLAVKGKLVAQSAADEPASALVEHCAGARAAMVGEGSSRKRRDLTPTATGLFDLPGGWEWVRIDDCFEVAGGIQKSGKRRPMANSHPYLRVANVQRGRLDLSELERFELFDGELERYRLHLGDLLVVEGNGSQSEIGRCARWDGEIEDCVHQNHLIRCRPLTHGLEAFALLYLNSPAGMEIMTRLAVTTSGLYNLSVGKIRSIPMPLPSRAEQRRIVQRVEELMSLCDGLEVSLRARTETAGVLAAGLTQVVAA